MLTKTEAVVLHSIKYGESKLIVDMFTRQHGRLSFVVALPKSAHARLKKQYFQPLTILTIACDVRPQLSLQKLSDASILIPLPTLLSTPSKLAISLFLAEFLYHALRGEQQNELLFDYMVSSLEWLGSRDDNFANFHLVFLMHLTRFLGFYPNLDEGIEERGELVFDLREGRFCRAVPLHRDFLASEEARVLHLLMRMDFHNMHLFRMNRQQRSRCVEVALQFYRLHLPDFPELRSLAVLKELWN